MKDSSSPAFEDPHPMRGDLPLWAWLVLPVVPALIMLTAFLVDREFYERLRVKEGPIELTTAFVLPIGIIACVMAYRQRHLFPTRWLGRWMVVCSLGMVYFMGEELSWGQHLFHWEAPEFMKSINRQDETNLHNIDVYLGRKPKYVIEIWSIIGCVIIPLMWLRKKKPRDYARNPWAWFWPTHVCVGAALLGQIVYAPTRIAKQVVEDEPGYIRLSELQEMYFSFLLVLYACSIAMRLRTIRRSTAQDGVREFDRPPTATE